MITPVTGNAYIVLFACSATLWTARVMDFAFPLIVGWINALMAITNFVLLSLPAVGTTGLYEAYSPHCMVLLDFKSADACNGTATVELRRAFQGTFTCANGTSLGFGETNPTWLPIYVDWAYALLIVLLLFSTLRRQVLSRMEKTYQPVGFAGKAMRWVIFISLALAIASWVYTSNSSANGSVGVCPSINNSTIGPIPGSDALAANCTCVELRMPGHVSSVSGVLREDSRSAARLIFDLI